MDHQIEGLKNNKERSSYTKKIGHQIDRDASERRRSSSSSSSSSRTVKRLVTEDVDKLADDFITKFRNQLKLEREESFKRFREMIARGV